MLNNFKRSALLLPLASIVCLALSMPLFAQDWKGGDREGGGPPMERSFHGMARGRWWNNGLTDDQKKKMDDIFQQSRLQLIDLNAAVQKQEAIMQPLIEADQPDESKILAQIDAIAQSRAQLEKANARMLFSIRQVLTPDQWKKLRTLAHNGPPRMNGDAGPGRGWRSRPGGNPPGPSGGAPPAPPSQIDQAPPTQ
jgi:Spy/CpxP family protein refolding chaperone